MKFAACRSSEIMDAMQNLALGARLYMTESLFHGEAIHGTVEDCDSAISHWRTNPEDNSHEDMKLMFGAYFGSILVAEFSMIWQESDSPDDTKRFLVFHSPTSISLFPYAVARDVISSTDSSFKSALLALTKEIQEAQSVRGDGIASVTPPTPPDMRVRIRRFLSDDGDRP